MTDSKDGFASEVAEHYNKVEQQPVRERYQSDIIELRRFNNAMKSMLQHIAFRMISNRQKEKEQFRVLELGCGKGGDLPKYLRHPRVGLVVGVDIADVSIEQCKERYQELSKTLRPNGPDIRGEFFVADLTRVDIGKKLAELNCIKDKFHLASSQFSLHYSFESYEQAVSYIGNASKYLEKAGVFIGSYPDGPKLVKLAREGKDGQFEVEDIMTITFPPESLSNPKPFGTKYHFKLKDLVDCPEFLVHPEVLERLMRELGFNKVFDRSFEETLIKETKPSSEANARRQIFHQHKALEFDHYERTASLNKDMWRAASIYRCFCYVKVK